ncbi:MAG: hypothetical protein JSR78_17405 [Proteobacteria bacterium]|nr:hypothetical protein [Pseudomonadota bacterium]
MRRLMYLLALICVWSDCAVADDSNKAPGNPPDMIVISPIFGKLVMFTLPGDFTTVFEQPTADSYIREAVLKGETTEKWSQMITVTGAKTAATHPDLSAQYFAAQIAAGFQKACPKTFAVKPLGRTEISSEDAFVAVASCGKIDASGGNDSETALIVAIKSAGILYTVQWAERTPANAENLTIDESKWKDRLAKLAPIRLCPIKSGEKPPYPSCVSK